MTVTSNQRQVPSACRSRSCAVVLAPGDIIFPFNSYVTSPIRLDISDGYITKIGGGLDAFMDEAGFEGKPGQTLAVPTTGAPRPTSEPKPP